MSSTAYPFGMVPTRQLAQGYNTQGFTHFDIEDGEATSIFYGDVVELLTTGYIEKDVGTTALTPQGVFVGCSFVNSMGYFTPAQAWPGGTTTGITTGAGRPMGMVVNDPNAVFMIQGSGPVPSTALGANAGLVQTAGTAAIGKSRNALDVSTIAVTSTLPLRIVGLVEMPDNAWGDAFTIVLVKFTNHQLTTLAGI